MCSESWSEVDRRLFLQCTVAGAVALALPSPRGRSLRPVLNPYLCGIVPISATSAAVTSVEPFQAPLRVPPVAVPVRTDATTDHYEITMREAQVEIVPGKATTIWGYDGLFPGPTVRARANRAVSILQRNELPEPMSIHLHGGHVRPEMDGLPTDLIPPGGAKEYVYPNRQRPATLWYHDHAMHKTPEHVYRGLAAFYLLSDDLEDRLGLPSGERDIPLLLQDRKIGEDGSLIYEFDHNGVLGNVIVVNGIAHPYFEVEAAPYRFRLVNGANARVFDLALDPTEPLTLIGTDGGLLPGPVAVPSVTLASAERAEIVIDFSRKAVGTTIVLRNRLAPADAPGLIRFDVVRPTTVSSSPLPATLRPVDPLPPPSVIRDIVLSFDAAKGAWVLNGLGFDPNRIDLFPRLGTTEVWRFRNESNFIHPMHLHLVFFQVLSRNGSPPRAFERGWKDTVQVRAGETVELAARFGDFTGTYVYHCHVLEHAERAMMAQFRVVDLVRLAGDGPIETAAAISAHTFAAGVPVAFVATAAAFADALAGGPAAAKSRGPVLLASGDSVPAATASELDRLRPQRIVVLGGPLAVPETVERELRRYTSGAVARIGGASRYETAAAVARAFFAPGVQVAYVATGRNFPDALAGGAAAAAEGGPVLLVTRDELPEATAEALRHLSPRRVVVLGGPAAVSNSVAAQVASFTVGPVERLSGEDRYGTAAAVARTVFRESNGAAFVATGSSFPDALAGVPAAAGARAPLLLVEDGAVPGVVEEELRRLAPRRLVVLGGPAAVAAHVEDRLASFL